MRTYRLVFKRSVDHMFVESEFIRAKSGLLAEWKLSDKYNISRNLIMSTTFWRK